MELQSLIPAHVNFQDLSHRLGIFFVIIQYGGSLFFLFLHCSREWRFEYFMELFVTLFCSFPIGAFNIASYQTENMG